MNKRAESLRKITVLSFCVLSLAGVMLFRPAAAEDAPSQGETKSSPVKVLGQDLPQAGEQSYKLTYDDLYEVGMALSRVRQQAINIYLEATRRSASKATGPQIFEPVTIPVSAWKPESCLPARREWLMFYMGTMEPIIRLMERDVDDTKSGSVKLMVASADHALLEKLWGRWQDGVHDINKRLDKLLDYFEDAPNQNKGIAEESVGIFKSVDDLEKVRREVYVLLEMAEDEPDPEKRGKKKRSKNKSKSSS